MILDKPTLHAQLALCNQNGANLQTGYETKARELEQLTAKVQQLQVELERHRGALAYNQLLIKQVEAQLEEMTKLEQAEIVKPTPSA